MSRSSEKKIECLGEGGYFPDSEFKRDRRGRLVHMRGEPHYTNGEPVRPDPVPGIRRPEPPEEPHFGRR